jgi:hypothetical protein
MMFDDLKAWYSAQFLTLKDGWGKLTIKWNVLLIALGTAWNFMPAEGQAKIVESMLAAMHIPTSWAVVAIGVIGFVLRMKTQTPPEPKDDERKEPV